MSKFSTRVLTVSSADVAAAALRAAAINEAARVQAIKDAPAKFAAQRSAFINRSMHGSDGTDGISYGEAIRAFDSKLKALKGEAAKVS